MRKNVDVDAQFRDIETQEYRSLHWSPKRALIRGWLNGLYVSAKIGDLIVVPGPGWRRDSEGDWIEKKSLIGEISGDVTRWERDGPVDYLRAKYLVRSVRWIAELDENDLDRVTQSTMRTQNALVQLRADQLETVLGAAYRNVLVKGEYLARFITKNLEFSAHESFHFQAFVMASSAAHQRATDGGVAEKFDRSIYEIAAAMSRAHEFVPEQDSSIHSPGYTTLKAIGNIPMVVACLYALALQADSLPFDANGNADIIVVNSESAALDPCDPDLGIDRDVREALNVIGFERWKEMCDSAVKANRHEGFEPITGIVED